MSKTFFFNADELYHFRTVNRLSQEALAAEIGISKMALNRIECHISDPSYDTLANIMYLYSVDGMVEFDRCFNHLPFDFPGRSDFILPELGDRRSRRPTR